ncbi:MATE family efflux transporter [Alkaliphilus hydrothermalis]|uniref:MATE family efflux protein n=1 Tax=Alkaliphilus hydrothermalis TaxID=1482730 RepID=A0ABS2NNH2_9FIRM|nr:MATE family efflux transporter [Alkaliphilus hydrothermalis]MBM7614471.1 putative MATE family efflux protein [Alkaliphilus hydrothermalis]
MTITSSNIMDRTFIKRMLTIALPISLQNLIFSSLNMVDTVMIGRLGEAEIAAVGLANQYFFILNLLLFGINSGGAIFTAQFWGKKDTSNIKRVLGITLILGGGLSILFAVLAFFNPEFLLRIFTKDRTVIGLGSKYLRIVSLSYFITAISFAYSFILRSIGQAKLPMVVSGVSLLTNTLLNYLLIFGNFGFPQMGIQGAALATLVSRGLEIVFLLTVVYRQKMVLAGRIKELFHISRNLFKRYIDTALPVILNEGFWVVGMTMYSISYARISTEAIASVQIANTVQSIFMVVAFGLGNSCAVMLGNSIGAKNEKEAIDYGFKFSILSVVTGILLGVLIFTTAPFILSFFNISDTVYQNAKYILMVISFFMTFKIFNTILIIGILRSGGDTKFSLILEMSSVWLYGVPLAFIGAHVLHLPIHWVVALVTSEEVVKAIFGVPRVISKKWVRNVVESIE